MPSIAEAISKIGTGTPTERLDACCALSDACRSSKSEAALRAVLLCLWDKKRCTPDIGAVAVKALPSDELSKVAYGHFDDDVRSSAIKHALSSYVPIDPTRLEKPKHVAIVAADGLKTGKEPHQRIVSLVGGYGKKIAPFLKSELSSGEGNPSGATTTMLLDLLSNFPEKGDDSHAERLMSRCGWDMRAAEMVSRLADKMGEGLLETAGERLADKCGADTLMGLLSKLGNDQAERFGSGMKRHSSFSGNGEIDYAIAKKKGDKAALMKALGNCPRLRSEAMEMLRSGEDRASAIRAILPAVYDSVDEQLLSDLLSHKDTLVAVVESVGKRLPGKTLARIAKGGDLYASAAAIKALMERGRSALVQLRQEDAEI
jgi:hypothetical protein